MKSLIIFILVCIFMVASGLQAFGEEWTPEQKEVIETVRAIWEAFKDGDIEAIMAKKHDDSVYWSGLEPFPNNKENIRYSYQEWIKYEKPKSYNLEFYQITVLNNVANVFFSYKYEGKGGTSFKGRSLVTLVKKDNKWLDFGGLSCSCIHDPPCPF